MHAPEITADFIDRLSALLDGEAVARPDSQRHDGIPVIRLHSPRVLLSISNSWDARPNWRASVLDWNGRHIHGAPCANFSSTRSLPEIAADLRRRVLTPARAQVIKHAAQASAAALKHEQASQRLDELAAILGPSKPYHNGYANFAGLRIEHEFHLQDRDGPWASFHGQISVHSFAAFKMIAAIIAEDHRLHTSAA